MPPQRQSYYQQFPPEVVITEQPAPAIRYRYECEGSTAGSIPGATSTPQHKTYPTIQIKNYVGHAIVLVSCVTENEWESYGEIQKGRYMPHPHNLAGKENCTMGVCKIKINPELSVGKKIRKKNVLPYQINDNSITVTFSNFGIQCVRKTEIEKYLNIREKIGVTDPFSTGFQHKYDPASIDLNVVRLCFQVFLKDPDGRTTMILKPVASEPIYNKRGTSELLITKLSACTSPASGGKEIILLCEKVVKEDIAVRFYEERNEATVWEDFAEFKQNEVHKQVAIVFRTPSYKITNISNPVEVKIQLFRPSDHEKSEPLRFNYVAGDRNNIDSELNKKRRRLESSQKIFDSILKMRPSVRVTDPKQSVPPVEQCSNFNPNQNVTPYPDTIKPELPDQLLQQFALNSGLYNQQPAHHFGYRNPQPQSTSPPQPSISHNLQPAEFQQLPKNQNLGQYGAASFQHLNNPNPAHSQLNSYSPNGNFYPSFSQYRTQHNLQMSMSGLMGGNSMNYYGAFGMQQQLPSHFATNPNDPSTDPNLRHLLNRELGWNQEIDEDDLSDNLSRLLNNYND